MKNKILSIVVMFVLIVSLLVVSVNALSFTATMTPSKTSVDESSEVIVKVKVSNLDVGTNGINSLSGYLKYDADVFEAINESNIDGLNSWVPTFDATTGNIKLTKNTFVTSAQDVFQITFKTKTGVSGKTGTISYSDIVASNSESNIDATDISTTITVGEVSGNTNITNNTSSNSISITANTAANNSATNTNVMNISTGNKIANNTTSNKVSNNSVSSYVNTMTNTTSGEKMPKTGADDTVLALIFVVIAIAVGLYIKIEKLNKDMY